VVAQALNEIKVILENKSATLDAQIEQLIAWIDQDAKIGSLKTIQGFIWQQGFEQGDFTGHVYADAFDKLKQWHQKGIALYVYSSGSVQAQQLLFQYSDFGDLRYLFQGYFDTQVGGKRESESYQRILQQIKLNGPEALFLSDVVAELDAAKVNHIQTVLLNRENQAMEMHGHRSVNSFEALDV
jgi:enolase-phosphatase E1